LAGARLDRAARVRADRRRPAVRVSRRGAVAGHDRGRAVRGALLGLPAGLLEDIFAGTGGGWTISTTIVGLLAGAFSRRMFADGAFVPAVLCGIAVLVRDLIFWATMRVEGFPAGFALAHFHTSLWRALLTALIAFLWLVVRRRLVTDKTTIQRYGYD
jgi:rod shape-determining protein MreD